MGQVLWTAVAVDDPPSHNKRIEDTRLLPIVLDLVTAQDISRRGGQEAAWPQIRRTKIVRLFRQAYAQKAVLEPRRRLALLHHEPEHDIAEISWRTNARPARSSRGGAPFMTWALPSAQGDHLLQAACGKEADQPGRPGDIPQSG